MNKSIKDLFLVRNSLSVPIWGYLLLLVLTGLLVYSNNYQGEFIFDDFDAIVNNAEIRSFSPVTHLLKPMANSPMAARPVVAISFALNYFFGGLDVWGYHLVNNLIHLLAGLALFGLIRATLLLPRFAPTYGAGANGYGLAVALLWLVHPLNTEAVDYLVCRTELLVGLFYLATMFFAAMAFKVERPRNLMVATVAVCALGMGSKEVMVSAPLMVVLYDRLFAADSFGAALRQRWKFYAALASTWLVVGFYQLDNPHGDAVIFDSGYASVLDYLRTQLTVIVHYLRLCFWPHPLVLDSQDWPIIREFSAALIWPLTLLGSLGVATVVGVRQGAWWAILGAWFFAILAPSSSVIPIISEIVTERRMYLPLVAVIVLVVFIVDHLWRRVVEDCYLRGNKAVRMVPDLALLLIAVLLGAITFTRNIDYRSEVSIWADTASNRPNNSRAHYNLGMALMDQERWAEAAQSYREAIRLFDIYLPVYDLAGTYSRLGATLANLGDLQEAVSMHKKALEITPDDAAMHYHLGNTFLRSKDLTNAAIAFNRAISLAPNFIPAQGNLGLVLMQQGDLGGAEQHFQRLLELAPMDANSYLVYGDFLDRQSRFAEAAALYRLGIGRGVKPNEGLVDGFNRIINEHPESGKSFD
ncbi:MAG: tetratricopeptide repeat protein [Proteobacteria bacterium]|nr:tetratricopeptide repeat protein [Pseudomonadota bacterium]MBU1715994.1 tetratricopeptide repeat protein [Pseudomonadota bacterium]